MPRLGGGTLRSQSFVRTSVGSNTETLPTYTSNLPIVSDRAPLNVSKPRSKSFMIQRGSSVHSDRSPTLPDRAPEAMERERQLPRKTRSSFRAVDRGSFLSRGDVLPTSAPESAAARLRSFSSSNVVASRFGASRRNSSTSSAEQLNTTMTQSLRNRRSSVTLEEDCLPLVEDTPKMNGRGLKQTWSDMGKTEGKPFFRKTDLSVALMNMRRGHMVQAVSILFIFFFVWDSYSRALSATEQLLTVKRDESMMMLHLKRLEEQSLNLHESITRLTQRGPIAHERNNNDGGGTGGEGVDADLLRVQYDQLKQMEDELNHEVKSLQAKIKQTDRANIVKTFGEGPVQVILEIDFPEAKAGGNNQISILLWYETPHAAWTLLDQVSRGKWDEAVFSMDKNLAIVTDPKEPDTEKRLDFVERGQKRHEPWTVGLTESDTGALSMFINLQDNSLAHKHDVCIGKIIDGFDTLQRLTKAVRSQGNDKKVVIKKATAAHLTRKEAGGLI